MLIIEKLYIVYFYYQNVYIRNLSKLLVVVIPHPYLCPLSVSDIVHLSHFLFWVEFVNINFNLLSNQFFYELNIKMFNL